MLTGQPHRHVYWIDALKALVVVGIALFHSALVFAPGTWIVNNPQRSFLLGAFAGFTFQWGIALLFLLAGAATRFGLRSRTAMQFASSRVVRLGLPLVAGLVVLSPLQWYVQHTRVIEPSALLRSYVSFWTSIHLTWHPSSAYDVVYHLWFLTHLLTVSIATLPIVSWLRSARARRFIAWSVSAMERRGGFLLGALPLAAVQVALHPKFPLYQDWSDLAAWAVLYVEGFIVMSDARFAAALRRSLWPALGVAVSILAVTGWLNLAGYAGAWNAHPDYSAGYVAEQALQSAGTWCWLVFFVAAGVRWLDHDNPLTEWGADRPLPFYVLSHPIIVVIARYVVGWDLGVWAKFAVIATSSIAATLVLCEVVSRQPVLRVLFGLRAVPKPRHREAHTSPRSVSGSAPGRRGA